MRKILLLLMLGVYVFLALYFTLPVRAQQRNLQVDGIPVGALPSICPSPVPGGGMLLQYVTDDQNTCIAGAPLVGGGTGDCIAFCSRTINQWLALGTIGASQTCANGLIQTGISGGVPVCSPPPLSALALAQIHYSALAALGPTPSPIAYWCIDCRQNTNQCAPAGIGTPAGVLAVPVATSSPFFSSVVFSCPNFAATAIVSPSATATPPLNFSISVGAPAAGPTPLAVSFTSSVSGGASPYTYSWAPGDGGTAAAGPTPSHTYNVAGTYTMTATVTDANSATATQVKTILATGPTYYVAPNGNDSNSGLTTGAPFLTLSKCQSAMRSGLKVCTLLNAGSNNTFTLTSNFLFTSSDNNEVWMAGWSGGTASQPFIEGNNNFNIQVTSATGMKWYGITFDQLAGNRANFPFIGFGFNLAGTETFRWDTFSNCNSNCLSFNGTNTNTVDSNTFNGMGPQTTTSNFFNVATNMTFGASSNTFSHNLCTNLGGGCIGIARGPSDPAQNNNTIDRNLSINTDNNCFDCGAYYLGDTSSGAGDGISTGNVITNNATFNNGATSSISGVCAAGNCQVKNIYLDQQTSNTMVTGNVCNLCGNWAVFNHCGGHNTVKNNVFDVSNIGTGGVNALYGYQNGCSPNGTMTGNTFSNNVVFDSGPWSNLGANGFFWIAGSGLTNPSSTTNDYWSPSGNAPNPSGNVAITDANPFNLNPLFTNPALNMYTVNNATVISNLTFTALATNQGPVNSPFTVTGSAF